MKPPGAPRGPQITSLLLYYILYYMLYKILYYMLYYEGLQRRYLVQSLRHNAGSLPSLPRGAQETTLSRLCTILDANLMNILMFFYRISLVFFVQYDTIYYSISTV